MSKSVPINSTLGGLGARRPTLGSASLSSHLDPSITQVGPAIEALQNSSPLGKAEELSLSRWCGNAKLRRSTLSFFRKGLGNFFLHVPVVLASQSKASLASFDSLLPYAYLIAE